MSLAKINLRRKGFLRKLPWMELLKKNVERLFREVISYNSEWNWMVCELSTNLFLKMSDDRIVMLFKSSWLVALVAKSFEMETKLLCVRLQFLHFSSSQNIPQFSGLSLLSWLFFFGRFGAGNEGSLKEKKKISKKMRVISTFEIQFMD